MSAKIQERPIVRRTLIVGLGGVGLRSVINAKKAMEQFFGKIPLAVRFLVLDADREAQMSTWTLTKMGEKKEIALKPEEFMHLPVELPERVIEDESIGRWWPKIRLSRVYYKGAGQYRAVGRLALHAHAKDISQELEKIVRMLYAEPLSHEMRGTQGIELQGNGIDIYIVASLAGGTGSGCFLDTAFILRQMTERQASKIYGYLVLPWIFQQFPATDRIKTNTYAALKELEYHMAFNYAKGGEHIFKFGLRDINVRRAPFDTINLMDGRNEQNQNIDQNGKDEGVNNLCALIGTAIALNTSSTGEAYRTIEANMGAAIPANWGGKTPYYCSFGTSTVSYPAEKHYNRVYCLFAMMLIDDGLRICGKGSGTTDAVDADKDLSIFLDNQQLHDEEGRNQVVDFLLRPGAIKTDFKLGVKMPTINGLKRLASKTRDQVRQQLREELAKKLTKKKDEATKKLRETLTLGEERNGSSYSLAFADKLLGAIKVYVEYRYREIARLEGKLFDAREREKEALEKAENITKAEKILQKKRAIYNNYRSEVRQTLDLEIEIERSKSSIELFESLKEVATSYRARLSLDEVSEILSKARSAIHEKMIGTATLRTMLGQFALLVEQQVVHVRGDKSVTVDPKEGIIPLGEFLARMNVSTSFNDFLKHCQFNTIGQLTSLGLNKFIDKLVSYSVDKTSFVKDMTLEEVLLRGIGDSEEQRMKLRETLQEAVNRATPMWRHEAVGKRASMMDEVFVLGVADKNTTAFAREDLNLSLPGSRSVPTFASTKDPWKLYCSKYKGPLAAYLLSDMEDYRDEYEKTPIAQTSHIERQIELRLPDLFPEEPAFQICLRAFTLARSPGFGYIDVKQKITDHKLTETWESHGEQLGENKMSAINALMGNSQSFERIKQELIDKFSKDRDHIIQETKTYLAKQKRSLENIMEQAMRDPNAPITLGDEIFMKKELDVLESFLSAGDVRTFLEKSA